MRKEAILIVESEPMMLNNLSGLLGHHGYHALCCQSAEEALQVLTGKSPGLVLSDINLPGMDGFDLLKRIRLSEKFANTPFVFISSRAERDEIRKGMNLGADDFLVKPFSMEELMGCVQTRYKDNKPIRESVALNKFESGMPEYDQIVDMFSKLTRMERLVMIDISDGLTSKKIAEKHTLSYKTIENHRSKILKKLKLQGPHSLVNFVFWLKGKNLI